MTYPKFSCAWTLEDLLHAAILAMSCDMIDHLVRSICFRLVWSYCARCLQGCKPRFIWWRTAALTLWRFLAWQVRFVAPLPRYRDGTSGESCSCRGVWHLAWFFMGFLFLCESGINAEPPQYSQSCQREGRPICADRISWWSWDLMCIRPDYFEVTGTILFFNAAWPFELPKQDKFTTRDYWSRTSTTWLVA